MKHLYYRLNVINLVLPPLRERGEDIVPMAEFLLKRHAIAGKPISITAELRKALMEYPWPGNVRELENVLRKLIVLRDPQRSARDLRETPLRRTLTSTGSASIAPAQEPRPFAPIGEPEHILQQVSKAKERAETEAILAALNSTRWNRKQAAALLKIDYKALLYKMKKLGVEDAIVAFAQPMGEEHPAVRSSSLSSV